MQAREPANAALVMEVGKVVPRTVVVGAHVRFWVVMVWLHRGRATAGWLLCETWQKTQVLLCVDDLIAAVDVELKSCFVLAMVPANAIVGAVNT